MRNTDDWRIGYTEKGVELGLFDSLADYDTKAIRGFIFRIASKTIIDTKESNSEKLDLGDLFP